jgi:hypothetical protein
MNGARYFTPLEMKMTRIVPSVTSQIRAQNIMIGNTTRANKGDMRKASTIITYFFRSGEVNCCGMMKKNRGPAMHYTGNKE